MSFFLIFLSLSSFRLPPLPCAQFAIETAPHRHPFADWFDSGCCLRNSSFTAKTRNNSDGTTLRFAQDSAHFQVPAHRAPEVPCQRQGDCFCVRLPRFHRSCTTKQPGSKNAICGLSYRKILVRILLIFPVVVVLFPFDVGILLGPLSAHFSRSAIPLEDCAHAIAYAQVRPQDPHAPECLLQQFSVHHERWHWNAHFVDKYFLSNGHVAPLASAAQRLA